MAKRLIINTHLMAKIEIKTALSYFVGAAKLLGQFSVCILSLKSSFASIPFLAVITAVFGVGPLCHILSHLLTTVALKDSSFLAYICFR